MLFLNCGCTKRIANEKTRCLINDDFTTSVYQSSTTWPIDTCVNIQLTANSKSANARAWPGLDTRKSTSRLGD